MYPLSSCFSVAKQKDKTEPFDVEEVVQEMPREQRQTLWENLASLLQDVLQDLPPDHWEKGSEEGMEVESSVNPVSWHIYSCCVNLKTFIFCCYMT